MTERPASPASDRAARDRRLARGIVVGAFGAAAVAMVAISLAPALRTQTTTRPAAATPALTAVAAPSAFARDSVEKAVAAAEAAAERAENAARRASDLAETARAYPANRAPNARVATADGTFYGAAVNGRASGLGLIVAPDGRLKIGEFLDGGREGFGADCASETCFGASYFGDFHADRPSGHGRIRYGDGSSYLGEVRDGVAHGFGVFTGKDGSRHIGGFREGAPDGYAMVTRPNGQRSAGQWAQGQLVGEVPLES